MMLSQCCYFYSIVSFIFHYIQIHAFLIKQSKKTLRYFKPISLQLVPIIPAVKA